MDHGQKRGLADGERTDRERALTCCGRARTVAAPMGPARTLYVIFFLSGLSGLVYESMWSRYLRLFVGSAATAQILVLALFMGGMSLGAWAAGRRAMKLRRPIVAYGLVEGAIGLLAFAYPWLYEHATRLCWDWWFPALDGAAFVAVKWTVAGALIFVPCVLLGMTFPLMSVGVLRRAPEKSGEILSSLYFSNSLGAAIGAAATGYLLVPNLGLPGSLWAAGVLNLLIMGVALLDRRASPAITEGAAPAIAMGERKPLDRVGVRLLLLLVLGTGLSSFLYEISWIRLLSMVLGSATRSFEVMLSAFVFGLALGGWWVRKRMDSFKRPILVLALVQLIMGLAAVSTLPLYRVAVLAIGSAFQEGELIAPYWYAFNALRYLACVVIMLPATFCAGMTLPLVTHVLLRRGQSETVVGRVYALNTLGAIGGAVGGGLLLLPTIGLKATLVVGAMVDMGLGLWALGWLSKQDDAPAGLRQTRQRAAMGTVMLAAIGLFVVQLDPRVLAAGVFRRGNTRLDDRFVPVFHVDGRTASITVMRDETREGYHTLYTNGKPDASVRTVRWPEGRPKTAGPALAGDEPTQFLVALITAATRPHAKQGALIGLGSGLTSHALLSAPELERLDTIEIEPQIAEAAKFFDPVNARVFEDPRSRLIFDDAKAYFAGIDARYDYIVSVPSNPWVSGVSSLFTVEFYREVKRYIAPGGVLAQWIQGYEISDRLLMTVFAALDREFADYRVYRVGSRDYLIVARPDDGVDVPLGPLDGALFDAPTVREAGELMGLVEVGQLESLLIANRELLHPFLATHPPNSDAHPHLDDGAERDRFFRASAEMLLSLRFTPAPLLEVLGGVERQRLVGRVPGTRVERHVLREPDKAIALKETFADDRDDPRGGEMRVWKLRDQDLEAGLDEAAAWDAWFFATYEVFNRVAPWLRLEEEAWWRAVQARMDDGGAPASIRASLELLDAMVERDGVRLWAAAQVCRVDGACRFDPRLVAIAGALGLELRDAPARERQAWARDYMSAHARDRDSDDRAYRVILRWAERAD